MVLGSLFSFLRPDVSALRDEEDAPRSLFARAGLRAINRQREQLVNQFGFSDTANPQGRREFNVGVGPARKIVFGGKRSGN